VPGWRSPSGGKVRSLVELPPRQKVPCPRHRVGALSLRSGGAVLAGYDPSFPDMPMEQESFVKR